MLETIDKLQRDFTDKYVVVDETIPELARFGGHLGQVKTINMNGRALVQFDAWNNIGWYDIEVDCLKVVDPAEFEAKQAEATKEKAKPAAKAAPSEAAKPPAASGAKRSTADILAAARANKGGGAAAPAAKPAVEKPAAAKPAIAKPAGGKMSTADILAAARSKKAAEGSAATEATTGAVEAPEAEPASTPEATAKPAKAAGGSALPSGRRATVPEILAWCREHDAK
jgi:hypothetical protein